MIVAAIILMMFYSHLPHANPAQGTFNDFTTPVPTVINPVSTVAVNRSVSVDGLGVTVTRVEQAGYFSNSRKHSGRYTVRVYLQTQNTEAQPLAIDFVANTRLLLPNGQVIAPQELAVSPVTMPKESQIGYLDFPVQDTLPLTALTLRFNPSTSVAFAAH